MLNFLKREGTSVENLKVLIIDEIPSSETRNYLRDLAAQIPRVRRLELWIDYEDACNLIAELPGHVVESITALDFASPYHEYPTLPDLHNFVALQPPSIEIFAQRQKAISTSALTFLDSKTMV